MSSDRQRPAASLGCFGRAGVGKMSGLTGKNGIRAFLLDHIGQIVRTEEIQGASGGQVQYSRRLRELRDEEGWPIQSHHDSTDLKPGKYRLVTWPPSKPPLKFSRNISGSLRVQVLERNNFLCQMCGAIAGDPDDRTGRPVRLHVGHIVDKSHGGVDTLSNLRALCSACNQGAKNTSQEPPSWSLLKAQIRRASNDDQRKALDWLKQKPGNP